MKEPAKLRNSQTFISNICWIFTVIFTLLTVFPFLDGNPFSGFWGMAFVSIFLSLASCLVAFIFLSRARKMDKLLSGDMLLARWELDDKTLQDYVANQTTENCEKNKAIMWLIAILFGLISIPFMLFLDGDEMSGFLLIMGSTVLIVFGASRFFPWYYQRQNLKGDRQVLIGGKYAYVNGYFHNWDFPLSGLSKIAAINKPFYGLHLTYYYTDRTLKHTHDLKIPAPVGMNLLPLIAWIKKNN
ncbi:MAG: hypothetical protein KJ804_03355 [Proteobacteria bacterium]|nr:hypothetical protein [Pseudomonadota bacterium]MBU1057341.1 hypothetical protein [Pseudomonadota bacterium]